MELRLRVLNAYEATYHTKPDDPTALTQVMEDLALPFQELHGLDGLAFLPKYAKAFILDLSPVERCMEFLQNYAAKVGTSNATRDIEASRQEIAPDKAELWQLVLDAHQMMELY